jgi:hypothetical protein
MRHMVKTPPRNEDKSDYETVEVPSDGFLRHVLPLLIEGDVRWEVSEEVREDISYEELADPSNVVDVRVDEDRLFVVSEFDGTVSEQVARATHWQPAEYAHHDVTVLLEATMPWPDEDDGYVLPSEGHVLVHQEEYPTEPPVPEYDPSEHA